MDTYNQGTLDTAIQALPFLSSEEREWYRVQFAHLDDAAREEVARILMRIARTHQQELRALYATWKNKVTTLMP